MKLLNYLSSIVLLTSLVTLTGCGGKTAQNPSPSPSASATSQTDHSVHSTDRKININTAILSELDKLEAKLGIPALSNKIQANRPYGSTEELVSKNVITQEQFDQIKDQVTIEDIVLTGEAKDIDFIIKMGLMKGHMIVAKELLDINKPEEAEPHIGHPVEEIYADVEDQLAERQVPDFKDQLIALQDLVKAGAKDTAKVDTEFKASLASVENAIAALPPEQLKSPNFVLQVINGLLDTANAEYTASIADGKIIQLIEYQDSRGFVIYAQELYNGIAAEVEKKDPQAHQTIQTTLTELAKAWPSVNAPETPVKTPDEVFALVQKIGQASQTVMDKQ